MSPPRAFTTAFQEDALHITLAAPRRISVLLLTVLWTCGWCLTVGVLSLDMLRHPDIELESNAVWLALWLLAGPLVGFVLLWIAAGQQEVVRVDGGAVHIERQAGPFRRTQTVDALSIQNIAFRAPLRRHRLNIAPISQFWNGAMGRVVIETARRQYAFGDVLTDDEVQEVVALLQRRLEHISPATRDRPAALMAPWMRLSAAALAAIVAPLLVWPAIVLPMRLAVTDRAICFADDSMPPARPAHVAGTRPDRKLYFIALDGVRAEQLEAVAEQFRARHRIPVEVAPVSAGGDAYDPRRRQVNAANVLDALARLYQGDRTVVIAVTDRDMYIPGFTWRYAFSYRRQNRLAVVSTARMERGCLGLFAASELRQAARLRKMIGKNVGALYFGLPLSADPRSLMYAYIGGPQELDRMSEVF
jgi:predicted Zn-dependent protease